MINEKLPPLPDSDGDFTPDIARAIVAKYQTLLQSALDELDELRSLVASLGTGANSYSKSDKQQVKQLAGIPHLPTTAWSYCISTSSQN